VNYYRYTADSGEAWSIRASDQVATLMFMIPVLSPLPRLGTTVITRKLRLVDVVTGKEFLVTDPDYFFTYPLGNLVVYQSAILIVEAQLEERGHSERPA